MWWQVDVPAGSVETAIQMELKKFCEIPFHKTDT